MTKHKKWRNIIMTVSNKMAIDPIKDELDYTLNPQERNELLTYLVEENPNTYSNLIKYISSEPYRLFHGRKRKVMQRADENWFCLQLDSMGDYILNNFDTRLDVNECTKEYSVQSRYALNKGISDGHNKRIVGLDTTQRDWEGFSKTVQQGLEVHIDMVDELGEVPKQQYRLSEDKKRKLRKEQIARYLDSENVNPDYVKMYKDWEDLGVKYGLHSAYSKEERQQIKSLWIGKFMKENHPVSAKERFMNLNKLYNQLGYDLYLMADKLLNPVQPRKKNQIQHAKKCLEDNVKDYNFFKDIDLTKQEHVAALLTIVRKPMQKTFEGEHYNWNEYTPIYVDVKKVHKGRRTYFDVLDSEFMDALKLADLDEMQRDIVEVVLDQHKDGTVYKEIKENPYLIIAEYINKKYETTYGKTDIKHIIEQKIAKIIANTYQDLENGLDVKMCRGCKVEKMASTNNYSPDTRNKSGLKGTCKKCVAKNVKSK
jgi:hypothetical protein